MSDTSCNAIHGFNWNIMDPFYPTMYWKERGLVVRSEEIKVETEDRRGFLQVVREARSYEHYIESCLILQPEHYVNVMSGIMDNDVATVTLQPKAKTRPQIKRNNPIVVSNCSRRPRRFFC